MRTIWLCGFAAVALVIAAWVARDSRADGLTFLPDPPAGVSLGPVAANGAATTTDGSTSFDTGSQAESVSWTVSSSHLELSIDQRTDQVVPECRATGAFVFTVDAPLTYTISGSYAYFPYVDGSGAIRGWS